MTKFGPFVKARESWEAYCLRRDAHAAAKREEWRKAREAARAQAQVRRAEHGGQLTLPIGVGQSATDGERSSVSGSTTGGERSAMSEAR